MEQIFLLVAIVVISLLHSWWKKRNGEGEEDAEPGPGQPQRRPPVAPPANRQGNPSPSNWEEELRRLLQGEEPARRVPPPVVLQQAPPPLPAPRSAPVRHIDPYVVPTISTRELTMLQSAQAFLHGSMAKSEVAEHMQREHSHVATHQSMGFRKKRSPEIQQAVLLVRSRQSQRAAILAGIILGPPKAMEG